MWTNNSTLDWHVGSVGPPLSALIAATPCLTTGPCFVLSPPCRLYMITWHIGLFLCIFLGQIGVQARKQGYF